MDNNTNLTPIQILLVEDNPGDVRLTRETLRETKLVCILSVAADGEEALSMLRREGPHASAPRPDLILLDLNLPKLGGREVLSAIKSDPALRSIPVVILTTSKAEEDIMKSYELHANCYISKPVEFEGFVKVVRSIEDFWFTVARLPKKEATS